MKKIKFFAIAMASFLTLGFVGCGANDDNIDYQGITLNEGESIDIRGLGFDSTASYPVHFQVKLQDNKLVVISDTSLPTEIAQQQPGMNARSCTCKATIIDFGEVKALSEVNKYPGYNAEADNLQYPAEGYADDADAIEGHGYVIEAHGTMHFTGNYLNQHDPTPQYMRIWLEEQTENGYKLRYEFPFKESVE